MGFLGNIFNDVVDIVTVPVKLVAKVTDDVLDSDIEDYVVELKETVKLDEYDKHN